MAVFSRWSNSTLTTVQMCGWKFKRRHLDNDRRPSGVAAKRGVAVHRVATEAHKLQMALKGMWSGDVPTMTHAPGTSEASIEARDIAADAFKGACKEGIAFTKEESEYGIKKTIAEAQDAAVDLSAMYVGEIAPSIDPVAVERKVTIQPRDSNITIVGKTDLIQSDDGEIIRDLKTGEKSPNKDAADVSQQLTMYHLIRTAETGVMPRAGRLVHLVRTPAKHEMKHVVQETTRDADDINRLVLRINAAVEAVEKGVFVPADPSAPGSPCGWCEYNDGTCPYYRRKS